MEYARLLEIACEGSVRGMESRLSVKGPIESPPFLEVSLSLRQNSFRYPAKAIH